jgi:hypothetical protein
VNGPPTASAAAAPRRPRPLPAEVVASIEYGMALDDLRRVTGELFVAGADEHAKRLRSVIRVVDPLGGAS